MVAERKMMKKRSNGSYISDVGEFYSYKTKAQTQQHRKHDIQAAITELCNVPIKIIDRELGIQDDEIWKHS